MANRLDLSEDARKLLRLHFTGRPLSMRRSRPESLPGRNVEQTRRAYRELVAAGLMEPVSTFAGGPEALYRLTEEADVRRNDWSRPGKSNPTVGLRQLLNRCPILPRQCLWLDETPVPPVGDQAAGQFVEPQGECLAHAHRPEAVPRQDHVPILAFGLDARELGQHAADRRLVERPGRHGRAFTERFRVEMPHRQVMDHVTAPGDSP